MDTETRPYPCPLAPYGCTSTFRSKNEWKRHVSTQHVKLSVYRCPLCPSNASAAEKQQQAGSGVTLSTDFNRKDLFTQHVRRMHMNYIWPEFHDTSIQNDPLLNEARRANQESQAEKQSSGGGKVPLIKLSDAAEKKLAELVVKGHVELRKAPSSCICPLCPLPSHLVGDAEDSHDHKASLSSTSSEAGSRRLRTFSGSSAWENRMEHMATAHLLPAKRPPNAAVVAVPPPTQWARDEELEEWLLEEGLAEVNEQGTWRCCGVRGNGH